MRNLPGVVLPDECPEKGREEEGVLEGETARILSLVPPGESIGMDDLVARAGMGAGPLLSVLLDLEMRDRVSQLPGRRFIRRRRRSEIE